MSPISHLLTRAFACISCFRIAPASFKRHRALNDDGLREEEGLHIIACRRRYEAYIAIIATKLSFIYKGWAPAYIV